MNDYFSLNNILRSYRDEKRMKANCSSPYYFPKKRKRRANKKRNKSSK
jgi:hypothetical protein